MDSAAASALLAVTESADPSDECTILRNLPMIARGIDRVINHRPSRSSNSNYTTILNTITRVQARKRQRDEAEYTRRDIGTQAFGYVVRDDHDYVDRISAPKRSRRDVSPSQPIREPPSTQSIGTNTTVAAPFEFPFPTAIPSNSQSISSLPTPPSTTSAFYEPLPYEYRRLPRRPLQNGLTNFAALPPNLVIRPAPSLGDTSHGLPVRYPPDDQRISTRLHRRASRRRPHLDAAPRLDLASSSSSSSSSSTAAPSAQQQIHGMVPISEHNCQLHCQLHNHLHSMSSGQHSVSPTIAPASMNTIRGQITAPPVFPYAQYISPIAPAVVPMMMGIMPMAPHPATLVQQNIYALAPRVQLANLHHIQDVIQSMFRPSDPLYPPMDRNGIDRHHMFAGLDIDIPIGATRFEIDNYTVAETYEKPEKDDEEGTCTVCLSGYEQGEKIRKLPCNHFFHPECIDKWLDINKRCPMCREQIDRRTGVPVL